MRRHLVRLPPHRRGVVVFAVDLPSFVRSFTQRGPRMAWLLGAGASVMSRLPSAGDLIRQFRHSVYCTENGLAVEQVDELDERVQQRILAWFAARTDLPRPGDPDEYSALFELAYDDPGDRAEFIRRLVAEARPNYGHCVMAVLMAVDRLRVVFTTNFDDLPEQAARSLLDSPLVSPRRPLVAADLGDPGAAALALSRESWPLVAKLHGDFLSDTLKNTSAELQAQDERMRQALLDTCRRFGLVVAGYSGRDSSVMQVLFEAPGTPGAFPAGLVWCHRPGEPPFPDVITFLQHARDAGVRVETVGVDNFIELLSALERAIRLPDRIREWLDTHRPLAPLERAPLPPPGSVGWPVLRTNALPVLAMPGSGRVLTVAGRVTVDRIGEALRAAHARGLVAARGRSRRWPLASTTTAPTSACPTPCGLPPKGTSFVVCCSQVFDADGSGMEFVAYDIGEGRDLRNQYLTREQMRLVMARSLAVYQRRHAGRSPARLIVHRQSPFRSDEVTGCLDAWGGAIGELTCVSVTRTPWRAVSLVPDRTIPKRSRPGYAVDRGTALQLDDRSVLVWVSGNARTASLSGRGNYLQGGKGTPRPLLLTRDAGRGPLTDIAAQVLALSKLDWNNDALYDSLPVTLRYAQALARTIKHIPALASRPYDYRLFM
jgi:hypothetical protein